MTAWLAIALLLQGTPAEPSDYWQGSMRGDTPATLAGASVIDDERLERLVRRAHPTLIDVSPEEPRPPGVRLWLPTHRSIPDSMWLPGAGAGTLDDAQVALLHRLAGDRRAPVVVFCHPHCWASWNAAKRLVRAGFINVAWYRGGIEGWQRRHATAVVTPDAEWVGATAAARPVNATGRRASADDRP